MPITDYHRQIFDFLEEYRRSNPDQQFTYALREKNSENRPRHLYRFPGDDDSYIYVGLYRPHNGKQKNRSIGLRIGYSEAEDSIVRVSLVIAMDDPKLEPDWPLYEDIMERIGRDKFRENRTKRYRLDYSFPNWQESIHHFLTVEKPLIDEIIDRYGKQQEFYISQASLEASLNAEPDLNTFSPPETGDDSPSYWVFQGSPDKFRIIDALRDEALQSWRVTAHAQRIKVGGKVILWASGKNSGCYALAEVASDPYTGFDDETQAYYQTDQSDQVPSQRVKIVILHNLWDHPVKKADIQGLSEFNDFKGGSQGTNFVATRQQFEKIQELSAQEKQPERRYWEYNPSQQIIYNNPSWAINLRDQIIALNFSGYETYSLDQYASQQELIMTRPNFLKDDRKFQWVKDAQSMFLFKSANEGDVVFAYKDENSVLGIGIITGPYKYNTRDYLRGFYHIRSIRWLAVQPWEYDPQSFENQSILFQSEAFSPTLAGEFILHEYIRKYPDYKSIFEKFGLIDTEQSPMLLKSTKYPKNIILYGPPGTGKTYETIDLAVEVAEGTKSLEHRFNKRRFDALLGDQIEFITFHQNYSYEDFVMGLKPDLDDTGTGLKFRQHEGIFYQIAKRARLNYEASQTGSESVIQRPFEETLAELARPLIENDQEVEITMSSGLGFFLTDMGERSIDFRKPNGSTLHTLSIATLKRIYEGVQDVSPNGLRSYYKPLSDRLKELGHSAQPKPPLKRYVLVIDEINRANMSRVFGELITLLEDDKRLGGENEIRLTLPSGERFAVPPNLYLIGTMNTADKSLALLDIALRRRFEFIGKYPQYEIKGLDVEVAKLLQRLNEAIHKHKHSADFLIGHAYFIGKQRGELKPVFQNRVIPLLMEYFSGRTEMVENMLREANIATTKNEFTFQLEVANDL